ncbi:MAG TPA: DUF1559 domain-containing protein [Gemmatales bacterium]|nr:DUF1559 domain-containing protein [Gemmatales bacterium]
MIRYAFTLVELIVVLANSVTILALVLPAIQYSRASYEMLACQSRLRDLSIALHHFHANHLRMPPLPGNGVTDKITSRASWRIQLLPYLEEEAAYKKAVEAYNRLWRDSENPPHEGYV